MNFLEILKSKTEEAGECWEWLGHASQEKFPQWRWNGTSQPARRVVWQEVRGDIEPGLQIGVKCKNPLCVRPEHLVARTKGKARKTGAPMTALHKIKITIARRKNSALNTEIVAQIRASTEPSAEVDRRMGFAPGYASRIRTGRAWKMTAANPFQGLGQR